MEIIQIIFFSIGSFFNIENSRIASWEVNVTIDPISHHVIVEQKDIFSVVLNDGDSARLDEEWDKLMDKDNLEWTSELEGAENLTLKFSKGKLKGSKEKFLNATISFDYKNEKMLEAFAMDYVDNQFSFINMDSWNISTEDGVLDGNYWHFPKDKPFTFTLQPFLEIPEQYKAQKISLYPWLKK